MRYKAEAFDVCQYLCWEVYDPLVRCRIDFAGRIDEETLKQAVTESLGTIPLMGCCFEGSGRKPYWLARGFTGDDMVRVVEAGSDADGEITSALSSRIDFRAEPQLKIIIVRCGEADTLCAVVSHLVCDAAGFKQYLCCVAGIYTKMRHGEPISAPRRYPRGTKPLYARTGLLEKIRIWRIPQPVHEYKLKDQGGVDFHAGTSDTYMEHRSLSPQEFASFRAFAKQNGATVNDGLMALYARAFCRETGTTHLALVSTIDLRRFIPAGVPYGITNYAGNCECVILVRPSDPLESTFAQISSQMRIYKTGKFALRGAIGCDLAMRLFSFSWLKKNFIAHAPPATVGFTNLGILYPTELDFDGLPIRSAYLTAAIKPRPYLQLTASSFEGSCTLSINIYGSQKEQHLADTILDDIASEIAALPGQPYQGLGK